MCKKLETLLLNFDETNKKFSCQVINTIHYELKSYNTWFLYINIIAEDGDFRQYIPQVQTEIVLKPGYPQTKVMLKQNETIIGEKIFNEAPWHHKYEVAKYIEKTLNLQMIELIKSGEDKEPMEIIKELNDENLTLKKRLKEMEELKLQIHKFSSELSKMNNKWYFKLAKLFQKM